MHVVSDSHDFLGKMMLTLDVLLWTYAGDSSIMAIFVGYFGVNAFVLV